MDPISIILESSNKPSNDLLVSVLEQICENGDIMIVKSDGLRNNVNYTVVITSGNNKFTSIRCDADSIFDALKKALEEYSSFMPQQGLRTRKK